MPTPPADSGRARRAALRAAAVATAAGTLLGGPAAVTAFAASPTHATTLTWSLSYQGNAGGTLKASGSASGTTGRTVDFQRYYSGGWHTFASARTSSKHAYSISTHSTLAGTLSLRVYVPASGSYKSVTGATKKATVKLNATAAALSVPSSTTWGSTAKVAFTGSTFDTTRTVTLQELSGKTWKTVSSVKAKAASGYVKGSTTLHPLSAGFSFKEPSWGTTQLRAVVSATALSAAGTSSSHSNAVALKAPKTYTGLAVDLCNVPGSDPYLAQFKQVGATAGRNYGAVSLYLGGPWQPSGCSPTAAWASAMSKAGWGLIPIYVGAQASCYTPGKNEQVITTANAASLGSSEGADAVSKAAKLGVQPGSPIYLDVEEFDPAQTNCNTAAVVAFTQSWYTAVHQHGYRGSLYANAGRGLSSLVGSSAKVLPDDLWYSSDNGSADTTSGLPKGLSVTRWSKGHIAHQFDLDVQEQYTTDWFSADRDYWNAPVAYMS